jgi:hypothetical protein
MSYSARYADSDSDASTSTVRPSVTPPASMTDHASFDSADHTGADHAARLPLTSGSVHVTNAIGEPKVSDAPEFYGDRKKSQEFLSLLKIVFMAHEYRYKSSKARALYAISKLRGDALEWMLPYIAADNKEILENFENFVEVFRAQYDDVDRIFNAQQTLLDIRQGSRSAAVLATEVRRLASIAMFDKTAIRAIFYRALNSNIKDALAGKSFDDDLDSFIAYVIRVDQRVFKRKVERERNGVQERPQTAPDAIVKPREVVSRTEPMEIGAVVSHSKLTAEEKQRRAANNLCFYCGRPDHIAKRCPNKIAARVVQNAQAGSSKNF